MIWGLILVQSPTPTPMVLATSRTAGPILYINTWRIRFHVSNMRLSAAFQARHHFDGSEISLLELRKRASPGDAGKYIRLCGFFVDLCPCPLLHTCSAVDGSESWFGVVDEKLWQFLSQRAWIEMLWTWEAALELPWRNFLLSRQARWQGHSTVCSRCSALQPQVMAL